MSPIWFVGIYLAILIAIAFWKRKESPADFLIAGRKLGAWSAAHSLSATAIGGGLILVGGAFVYKFGISALWFFIGKACGYGLLTVFANKLRHRIYEKKYFTLADYFFDFHGKLVGKFVAALILFAFVGWTVVSFMSGAKIITFLSDWTYEASLLLMVVFTLFYMILGGFRNVVRTDIFQFIAFFVIFCMLFFILTENFEKIEPTQWELFGVGIKNTASFFLAGFLFPFSAMEIWQRIYALDKRKTIVSMMSKFAGTYLAFGVVLAFTIMLIRAADPNLNPDLALIEGISNLFPEVFAGLGMVAFFAAIMSSADSYFFVANATLVQDFLDTEKKMGPRALEQKMRWTMFILGLGILTIGLLWQSLVDVAFYFSSITVVVSILTLSSWWSNQKVSKITLLSGGIVGLLGVNGALFWISSGPTLILVGVGATVVGVMLGAVFSKLRIKN